MSASTTRRAVFLTALGIARDLDEAGQHAAFHDELEASAANATAKAIGTLETALLTHFREAIGPDVDAFWDAVADQGLPYRRPDLVGKVMCRGHLRTNEYDVFADGLAHLQATGQIAAAEAAALEQFLDDYEARHPDEFLD